MSERALGEIVVGVVVEHRPFGVFVDVGEAELAVATITAITDDPPPKAPPFPAVGTKVEAVFLGYSGPDRRQPRLSLRPSDLEASRRGRR